MPAQYVKPYIKGNKNDFRDAEAIAEAVQRPTMRFVPVKTVEQLDLQALHRVRSRLVGQRTAVINQIRGFLLEHGVTVRQGSAGLRQALPCYFSPNARICFRLEWSNCSKTSLVIGTGSTSGSTPSPVRSKTLPGKTRTAGG